MDFDLELEDILYTVKENKTGEKPDAPKEEILEKAETEVPAVSETEAENSVPDEQQQAEPENLVCPSRNRKGRKNGKRIKQKTAKKKNDLFQPRSNPFAAGCFQNGLPLLSALPCFALRLDSAA